MAIEYKLVSIPNFDNDAETKAALDAEGVSDWELVQMEFRVEQDSSTTAIGIFKK